MIYLYIYYNKNNGRNRQNLIVLSNEFLFFCHHSNHGIVFSIYIARFEVKFHQQRITIHVILFFFFLSIYQYIFYNNVLSK